MHYGIDVSSNNTHPINWVAAYAWLKQQGGGAQPFAIVKATQGTGYVNELFSVDVHAAAAAGFAVGAYLMDEGNADPAAEEAAFRKTAGGLPQFDDDELPMGDTAYAAHCAALVAQNPAAVDYLNQSEEDAGFPAGAGLWEANYNNQPGVTHRPGVLIHQYSATGIIPGLAGIFDLNVWLGTEARFAQVFHLTAAPAVSAPHGGNMLAFDPVTGGTWALRPDGSVFAADGAPYLGGLNIHPDWNAGAGKPLGPAVGIAPYGPGGHGGYEILCDNGTGPQPARYRFPRDGSQAKPT